LKILLVDDEDMILGAISRLLEKMGHIVDTASCGEEAVEKFSRSLGGAEGFALVIADINMPESFGAEELLKRLRPLQDGVRVVVSSGQTFDPLMENYMDHGFFGAVTKPFSMDTLNKVIEKASSPNS